MKSVVFFDDTCRLCMVTVSFIIRNESDNDCRFAPLRSETARRLLGGKGVNPEGLDSVALLDGERLYLRSDAVIEIARRLRRPWNLIRFLKFIPRPLRDVGYRIVARLRYAVFGKVNTCDVRGPELRERMIDDGVMEETR